MKLARPDPDTECLYAVVMTGFGTVDVVIEHWRTTQAEAEADANRILESALTEDWGIGSVWVMRVCKQAHVDSGKQSA